MSDFEARIEKYFEGTSLGLAAVADVLSKMDDRFEKADQEEYEEFQKEQYASERHALIKDVIAEIVKEGADYDLDLKIDPKSVGGTASTDNDKSAGDASETTSFDNKTETAGASIQAEDDEDENGENGDEENGDEEDEEDVGAMIRSMEKALAKLSLMYKGDSDEEGDDEMSSEYPQDEEKSFDQSITKSLGTDVKNIMAKMGIKESGSTQVKRVALSPEISPSEAFISKSNNGEQSVDFTKLTYKELRRLEDGIRNGSITEVEL
tara:strand:+ start:1254 stop:2048 length:795 start_codon:yes stop_codon:yes gene_type:complete